MYYQTKVPSKVLNGKPKDRDRRHCSPGALVSRHLSSEIERPFSTNNLKDTSSYLVPPIGLNMVRLLVCIS